MASALAACGDLTVYDTGRGDYPGGIIPRGESLKLPYGGNAKFHSFVADAGRLGPKSRPQRRRHAQRLIDQQNTDLVVVDHPTLAGVALGSRCRRRVMHTHNVESLLAKQMRAQSPALKYWLRERRFSRIERKQFPRFDQIWAVSDEDAAYYRHQGLSPVELMPNIVPPSAFATTEGNNEPGTAAFFGWMAYPPNAEAAANLLDIAPQVQGLNMLYLIGKGLPDSLKRRAGQEQHVQALGYVDDLAKTLQHVQVVAIPLLHGAGTKLKVIEALAMGKAVVTTPIGAEGLRLADGTHALIAAPGDAFVEALSSLLRNPIQQAELGAAGRDHALEHFSLQRLTTATQSAVTALLA